MDPVTRITCVTGLTATNQRNEALAAWIQAAAHFGYGFTITSTGYGRHHPVLAAIERDPDHGVTPPPRYTLLLHHPNGPAGAAHITPLPRPDRYLIRDASEEDARYLTGVVTGTSREPELPGRATVYIPAARLDALLGVDGGAPVCATWDGHCLDLHLYDASTYRLAGT